MYLNGGDDRSTEAGDRAELPTDADSFAVVWAQIGHSDHAVHRRAAHIVEKVSRERPDLIEPYKNALIHPVLEGTTELCPQLVAVSARLDLNDDEAARLMRRLEDAVLNHPSDGVQSEALAAAFTLAARNRRLALRARELAKHALIAHAPEVAERARELLRG